jgi:NAD(P)-dependent dehydrogenase (short-subunit alcohol dehydrogenase family)
VTVRGRVAIVVGASGGIGAATVRALCAQGATVVLAALPDALLDAVAKRTARSGAPFLAVPTDVTKRSDIDRLVARTLVEFGRVDVLVNAAGVATMPSLAGDSDEGIERVVAVNLLGCARAIHAVLPVMKAQRRGAIVSIGSVAGEIGLMGIYSASKFGLRGLCDSVRREVRSYGIGVTLVEPGFVQTELNAGMTGLPPPEIVADAVLAAIRRPRRRIIVPPAYRLAVAAAQALPGFFDVVLGDARIQRRLNRDALAQATSLSLPVATSKTKPRT